MSVKRVPVLVRFLPLISALASTMGVAQQPRTWPDDIESLLFEYLSNLPGKTLPSLEVHCTEHGCLAVFIRTTDGTSVLGHEELSPIVAKGWNVVSIRTGGGFDPATGAHSSFVHFTNDGGGPPLPFPPQNPPPRFIRLVGSHAVAPDRDG
jgi:hypothetical protein